MVAIHGYRSRDDGKTLSFVSAELTCTSKGIAPFVGVYSKSMEPIASRFCGSFHGTHVPSGCGLAHEIVGSIPDAENKEPKHI